MVTVSGQKSTVCSCKEFELCREHPRKCNGVKKRLTSNLKSFSFLLFGFKHHFARIEEQWVATAPQSWACIGPKKHLLDPCVYVRQGDWKDSAALMSNLWCGGVFSVL